MMALSEVENVTFDNENLEPPLKPLESAVSSKDPSFSHLNEQNTILSLTLNEIQLKRGKSLGSMNMDEFLSNLWSADENKAPSQLSNQNEGTNNRNVEGNQPALVRQCSLSIPTPLCKKTVDELWFEITKEQSQTLEDNNTASHEPPRRQQTLGEMTLEDFLVKAGVIREASRSFQKKMDILTQGGNCYGDVSREMGQGMEMGLPTPQDIGNSLMVGNGFMAYQMFSQKGYTGEAINEAKNAKGNGMTEIGPTVTKKRIIDCPPEVVVERRQRRMIKNRESAARSRARKQAYTVELELELNQLKEENAKLKQIVGEIDQKRKEQVIKRKPTTVSQNGANKLRTLRRAVSLTW